MQETRWCITTDQGDRYVYSQTRSGAMAQIDDDERIIQVDVA